MGEVVGQRLRERLPFGCTAVEDGQSTFIGSKWNANLDTDKAEVSDCIKEDGGHSEKERLISITNPV